MCHMAAALYKWRKNCYLKGLLINGACLSFSTMIRLDIQTAVFLYLLKK